MKKGLTELVFIMDKSGSMSGLENDTIGGYNSMLKRQQEVKGECFVTTALFNNNYELLHDRIDIRAIGPITEKEYCVGGMTALIDAIGRTINKIDNVWKHTAADYRAEKVMFVIITDGMENASYEYSAKTVKDQIERHKAVNGWEFIFLGANIDAVETARDFGIDADRAQNFHADNKGIRLNFSVINETVATLRECGKMPKHWKDKIQEDYHSRSGK